MRGLMLLGALLLLTACGAGDPPAVEVEPSCEGAPALQVDGAKLCQWSADGLCGVCTMEKTVALYEVDGCQWAQTHNIPNSDFARSESDPPSDGERDTMDCLDIVDAAPGGEWRP